MSDKFGLDYLIKRRGGGDASAKSADTAEQDMSSESGRGEAVAAAQATEYIERATASIGSKILEELKRRKDQGGSDETKLRELVDALGVDWDTLNFVCRRLESLGMVEFVPDKYGDHSVKITKIGEDSLKISSL